jgi:hypothetical protein
VHADPPDPEQAGQGGQGDVRGLAIEHRPDRARRVRQQRAEERLPARPEQDRKSQLVEVVEVLQQQPVVVCGLREAQPRVDGDPVGGDAGGDGVLDASAELVAHHADHVGVRRPLLHGVGMTAPVHRDVRRVPLRHDAQDVGVGEATGDVVHDDRAGVECSASDLRPHRVDRDERTLSGQLRDHGYDARELLGDERAGRPGPGRLASDVEQVRTLRQHREATSDRVVGREVPATVGERVGSDVHDTHHQGMVELREPADVAHGQAVQGAGGHR